jgi:hypothetical protein
MISVPGQSWFNMLSIARGSVRDALNEGTITETDGAFMPLSETFEMFVPGY